MKYVVNMTEEQRQFIVALLSETKDDFVRVFRDLSKSDSIKGKCEFASGWISLAELAFTKVEKEDVEKNGGNFPDIVVNAQKEYNRMFEGLLPPCSRLTHNRRIKVESCFAQFGPDSMIDVFNTLVEGQKLPIFSIPGEPYNELLVGKLVALCALTPYVIDTYRERYKNRPSEIASQMLGESVCRTPDLVYVGTTSLYSVGSSQYNRLVLPGEMIGASFDLRFQELEERTQGFGTFHISRKTIDALEHVLEKDGSHTVNHQFGEGASPKLRLLGEGVRALLKSDGNASISAFTSHAMPRIIYAAPLISNCTEYLLGIDKRPRYYSARGLMRQYKNLHSYAKYRKSN